MKITYDKSVDAIYIKLNERASYEVSKKISEDVLIDYAKDGRVVGIEVLAASENAILPSVAKASIPVELSSKKVV